MAYAYYKKIARINLTTGTVAVEQLDTDLAKKFIGGRGLGAKIVYDEGCATADPMGPGNKLVYITGPMTGAEVPSSGRYMVVTKSPLTGMITCSNSGGIWGAMLKHAGWDALIVEGEAPEWSYINIIDDKIELLDARAYLGMFSTELDEKLKEKHGKDSSALTIGIAGEKKVLLAVIMNDKDRAAGRSGVGAVMGSKKLKGIVVSASKNKANKTEDISGEALAEKLLVKAGACHRCPKACSRVVKSDDKVGSNAVDMWCNEYGLDAISVSSTIAAAMELYQRGIIKEEECAGAPLEWGNAASAIAWTKRIGDPKTPLDWMMSSGSARLCEHYSISEASMSFKKQKRPASAASNRGGSQIYAPEVIGLPVQPDCTVTNQRAFQAKTYQDLNAVIDSMGLCLFTSFALGVPEYTKLLNAACGTEYTPEQVLELGERIYNIERMFNKAAGMKPEDDCLPKRLLKDSIPDGSSKGSVSPLPVTLREYYEVRGWEAAFPTDETLKRLGLEACISK